MQTQEDHAKIECVWIIKQFCMEFNFKWYQIMNYLHQSACNQFKLLCMILHMVNTS